MIEARFSNGQPNRQLTKSREESDHKPERRMLFGGHVNGKPNLRVRDTPFQTDFPNHRLLNIHKTQRQQQQQIVEKQQQQKCGSYYYPKRFADYVYLPRTAGS